nr:hypothetical protein CFP56_42823 [Quercus suber]
MSTMAMLDNLIDPTTRSWRVSKIDHVFLPHEVEVIKSIPLSNRVVQDIQTWACTNTGGKKEKADWQVAATRSKGDDLTRRVAATRSRGDDLAQRVAVTTLRRIR